MPEIVLACPPSACAFRPLDRVELVAPPGTTVVASDGAGRDYARVAAAAGRTQLALGGALGVHRLRAEDAAGRCVAELTLRVEAETAIDDGGPFAELFQVLVRTMRCYSPSGTGSVQAHGRAWRYYVPWILDHVHTAKGMRYLSDATGELLDLWQRHQRRDGMVWSNLEPYTEAPPYHYWAYKDQGYAEIHDGLKLMRQPVENHNEYNYVDGIWTAWKASGDATWMAGKLGSALRALEYSCSDPARWSTRFGLLKRGNTIDSWDFQAAEPGRPAFVMGEAQQIDPQRTRFVVFFGDNHGYALACDQLAEMLRVAGRAEEAERLAERGRQIRQRLDAIAWNGRFFTHHVEDDPTTRRDLGVDESAQIAMSNAYALNRGIPAAQAAAVLRTYRDLRASRPEGSPAEWYAIYPPYGKGFGHENGVWQYMNGGVHGHAGGELARGAFAHGDEAYGVETLLTALELARRDAGRAAGGRDEHRTTGIVRFAYTGAASAPPLPPAYEPVALGAAANMALGPAAPGAASWMAEWEGNDLRGLPTGRREFCGVPFSVVAGPGPACAGVGPGLAAGIEIHMGGRRAGALHLLHAANNVGASGLAGILTIRYQDGGERVVSIMQGRHLAGWWFPGKPSERDSGVAWRGASPACGDVGIHWCAIAHPEPERAIRSLHLAGSHEGSRYALAGLTLADRMPWHAPDFVSFGGPDNWAGGLMMAALAEGLCGVVDGAGSAAFAAPVVSPRWSASGRDAARVTLRYPASGGYVSYRWSHDAAARRIALELSGNAAAMRLRILLPAEAGGVAACRVGGAAQAVAIEAVGTSRYAVLEARLAGATPVELLYTAAG